MGYDRAHGWRNIQTRAIASAIWESKAYVCSILRFMNTYLGNRPYRDWLKFAGLEGEKDEYFGIYWDDKRLSYSQLNDYIIDVFYQHLMRSGRNVRLLPIVERSELGYTSVLNPVPDSPPFDAGNSFVPKLPESVGNNFYPDEF